MQENCSIEGGANVRKVGRRVLTVVEGRSIGKKRIAKGDEENACKS